METELSLTATPESLTEIRASVRSHLSEHLSGRELEEACLAIGEACTNVVEHAYRDMDPGPLRVKLEVDATRVRVTLRDRGHPVDPATCKGRDLADVRPGGLGIHFMKCAFDPVEYGRDADGWNRLTLVRKLRT